MNSSACNASVSSCALPPSFWAAVHGTNYAAMYVLMPLRFIFGVTGQLLALMAFKQHANAETGYTYQLFVTIGKIVEISYYVPYTVLLYHWGGGIRGIRTGVGTKWFRSCYGCMWCVAHICGTVVTVTTTLSLLLATATAADRAFALAKPFLYRRINHKKHQILAVVCCVAISLLISVDSSWRNTVVEKEPGVYSIVNAAAYSRSTMAAVVNLSRMGVRFVGVGIMGVSYCVLIKFFEKRLKQVAHMSNRGATKTEIERKRHQKTLYVLVMFELPFMLLITLLLTSSNALAFFAPAVHACQGTLLFALGAVTMELADILEIYIILAASPAFRRMVINAVPFLKSLASCSKDNDS